MPASPNSLAWPVLLSVTGSLLPVASAIRARVSLLREPAGQVGAAWLVFACCTVLQMAFFRMRHPALVFWVTAITILLFPLLLGPPMLTWAGPRAKRLQPALFGATVALGALGLATIGPGRQFQVIAHPTMSVVMTVLVLLAMRAQAEHHAALEWGAEPLRAGWTWIGGGHLVYFLSSVLWFPLMETLVPRDWRLVVDVNMALLLLHTAAMVAIAFGIALVGARDRGRREAPVVTPA